MQSAARIAISVLLITSVLATTYQNAAKLRRDGVLNLYPFPRVGRASQAWNLPLEDLVLGERLAEYKENQKRQMYAFPRVGRGDAPLQKELLHLEELPEVRGGTAQNPMRSVLDLLRGRSHSFVKRGSEKTDSTGMWFGPRLGRAYKDGEDELAIHSNNETSEPEQPEPDQGEREKRQI